MVDFHTQRPTMQLADPEDRALLGSNPSAAVGDGDNRRGVLPDAPAPFHISLVVLVRKAINPSFTATQLWLKLVSLTRPVCHLARSPGTQASRPPMSEAEHVNRKRPSLFRNYISLIGAAIVLAGLVSVTL